jgi:hypothetical protein
VIGYIGGIIKRTGIREFFMGQQWATENFIKK